MSSTTTNLALPYPVLTDPPNVPSDIQALAAALEALLGQTPLGDPSHSAAPAADTDFHANDNIAFITSTFTLTRSQYVLIGARASVYNNTSNASGKFSIRINIDGASAGHAFSAGWQWVGAQGTINERIQWVIPTSSVLLSAGSHTVTLIGDRDNTVATHTAQASSNAADGSHTVYPNYLSIIV